MQSKISHIQFNVQAANLPFLQGSAGLRRFADASTTARIYWALAMRNETSLWFGAGQDVLNDHDGPGMNHLALEVPASDVDAAVAWLLTERSAGAVRDPATTLSSAAPSERTTR